MTKALRNLLTIAIIFTALAASAINDRNHIYLIDCTGSMVNNGCWLSAKQFLDREISSKDGNDRITIIPFKEIVFPSLTFLAQDYNANEIDKMLEKALAKKMKCTSICRAWDAAQQHIDKGRDNYIVLLTDGKEESNSPQDLYNRLKAWKDNVTPNINAFYVMLTPEALTIKDAVGGDGENLFFINATKEIPTFAALKNPKAIDSYRFARPLEVPVAVSCGGVFQNITANCNDPNFKIEVVNGIIQDGKLLVRITSLHSNVSLLNKALNSPAYELKAQIDGSKSNLIIANDLRITINNRPNRALSSANFDEEMPYLGIVHYYPSFLFWREKSIDTLYYDIKPEFSPEAIESGAVARFKATIDGGHILVDKKIAKDGIFTIDSRYPSSVKLGVLFDGNATSDEHILKITVADVKNLESIQGATPATRFRYCMKADFERDWNPLSHILMWIGIIASALLVIWFLFIKRLAYPTFKVGRMQITDPYYSSLKIKGARKVILTNSPSKQSFLNKLFTGKIVYEANPIWTQPVVFESSKGKAKLQTNKFYSIDPYASTLIKQVEYSLTNNETNKKIKLTVY